MSRVLNLNLNLKVWAVAMLFAMGFVSGASGQTIGTVRLSEVIAAHPRMMRFDPKTHRFLDGLSAKKDVPETRKEIEFLKSRLEGLEAQEKRNLADLQVALTGKKDVKTLGEEKYWKAREGIKAEGEKITPRISELASAIEFNGRTSEITLFPEIKLILTESLRAVSAAAASNRCILVLTEAIPVVSSRNGSFFANSYSLALLSTDQAKQKALITTWLNSRHDISGILYGRIKLVRPAINNAVDLTDGAIYQLNLLKSSQNLKGGFSK